MAICIQCNTGFEEADLARELRSKVSPIVGGKKLVLPDPKKCPNCRRQHLLSFRNERNLYHGKSDFSGKPMITVYSSEKPFQVYSNEEWWSDAWNALDYGREVNFNRPFFSQWAELQREVPRRNLIYFQNENSDYTNVCSNNKNCYLLFSGDYNEECFFSFGLQKCSHCLDCSFGENSQWCYECFNFRGSYSCLHCVDISNCTNGLFLMDCRGCSDCAFSVGLRNKQFYIFNQPHSREDYFRKMEQFKTDSRTSLVAAEKIFNDFRLTRPHKNLNHTNTENCTGDYLYNCKKSDHCFNLIDSDDCAFVYDSVHCKSCLDCVEVGYGELCYQTVEIFPNAYGTLFSCFGANNISMIYSDHCYHSKNCFGCVGLRHREYCILNKQYTKEDYVRIVDRIVEHMEKTNEWGEFFPLELSPFAYNETVAQEFFPLQKNEAEKQGWKWNEHVDVKSYKGPVYSVADSIEDIKDDITENVLLCESTGRPYRIIPQEVVFYRKLGLPIPRRSPDQRHKDRISLRNPRQLWSRTCAECSAPIQTTYQPNRPEIVYCEKCYLTSVY